MADFGTPSSKFFGRGQGGEIKKNNISEIASIKLAIKRIDILVICNSLKDGAIQNIKRRNIFASCFMHKSGAFPWLDFGTPSSKFFGRGQGGEINEKITFPKLPLSSSQSNGLIFWLYVIHWRMVPYKISKDVTFLPLALCIKVVLSHGWILAPPPPSSLVGAKAAKSSKK